MSSSRQLLSYCPDRLEAAAFLDLQLRRPRRHVATAVAHSYYLIKGSREKMSKSSMIGKCHRKNSALATQKVAEAKTAPLASPSDPSSDAALPFCDQPKKY